MKIGLSCPWGFPGEIDLSQFTGNDAGEIDDVKFEMIGERHETKVDVWFILDDLFCEESIVSVAKKDVFYVSSENIYPPDFFLAPNKQRFLNQFSRIYSCFPSFRKHASFASPFLPWMVNSNHGSVFRPHERDINFLSALPPVQKTKELSVFCSAKATTPEQRMRLAFVEELKKYFGSALDWFGNGINSVDEKWDGLADYRVTLALENRQTPGMYTEKIFDPFLAWSLPLYWGAPDIQKFLPIGSNQILDLRDFKGCAKQIHQALKQASNPEAIEQLREGRALVLGNLHFLKRLIRIAKSQKGRKSHTSVEEVKVRPQRRFRPTADLKLARILRNFRGQF